MGWLDKVVGASVGYAVAGPAGAVIGATYAGRSRDERGYDMSDIPFGVHVEASHEDDEIGRRWTLCFVSDVPSPALAEVRLLDDTGTPLPGRPPFADERGRFIAAAPIREGRCVLYVPRGAAVYASPKHISLEVSVWRAEKGAVGKAILDADLPAPAPLRLADYLAPIVSLCVQITGGDLEPMFERLAGELGSDPDSLRAALPLEDAARVARFRFPQVSAAEHVRLFEAVCFGDREPSARERAKLEEVAAALG